MKILERFAGQLPLAGTVAVLLLVGPRSVVAEDKAKARDLYREANTNFDRGQFKLAADTYKSAIAEDSQFGDAYHNLALANEMVDRKQAIEDWKKFIQVAEGREEYKFDVARIRARVQILESMPALPEAMQPARYVLEAGDYYWTISRNSEGEEWTEFPVKVFLGSAQQLKWQEGAREAFDTWAAVFPLQLVALSKQADIRLNWEGGYFEPGRVGEEEDWVQIKPDGEGFNARRIAVITVNLSAHWGKNDMRAIIAHELGHALGVKGHSDSKKDIMYMEKQDNRHSFRVPGFPLPITWRSLVKQPSQRDINTLIRLYNHPGSSVRFK
ncbi:MAG: matrixin family metalloprotease [Acidobacteria bacterium]|nr:matrixin family metalloprotease [Acidobacteriota bacterium]